MDSHRSEGRSINSSLSPPKLGFHRSRKTPATREETVHLRTQLDQAKQRIAELETDVERLLQDDARNRRKFVEEKFKHEEIVKELKSKAKRKPKPLPEELESEVGENLASVNELHKEVLQELTAMQRTAQQRTKDKELDLHRTYTTRVKELERELETQRTLFESEPMPPEPRPDPVLLDKIAKFEEFNTHLMQTNKDLRMKVKEAQSLNAAYAKQYSAVIKENTRLKQLLKDLSVRLSLDSMHTASIEELPSISVRPRPAASNEVEALQAKLAAAQKELRSLKMQAVNERERRSELLTVLEKCIEDVRRDAVAMATYSGRFHGDVTEKERELVIKHLLEQQEVLELVKKEATQQGRKTLTRSSSVASVGKATTREP